MIISRLTIFYRSLRWKHPSRIDIVPYFPPEIWGLVIHHTSLLYHGPLDTSNELSFVEQLPLRLETYRVAMKLKTAIALVSKQ